MSDLSNQVTPQDTAQVTPQVTSQVTPQDTAQDTPQDTAQYTLQVVPQSGKYTKTALSGMNKIDKVNTMIDKADKISDIYSGKSMYTPTSHVDKINNIKSSGSSMYNSVSDRLGDFKGFIGFGGKKHKTTKKNKKQRKTAEKNKKIKTRKSKRKSIKNKK